jgi:hypothetical protein
VTPSGDVGSGAVYTVVLTNNRVTDINVTGTLTGYSVSNIPILTVALPIGTQATATTSVFTTNPTISFPFPTTLGLPPYMIRCNNLSSPFSVIKIVSKCPTISSSTDSESVNYV